MKYALLLIFMLSGCTAFSPQSTRHDWVDAWVGRDLVLGKEVDVRMDNVGYLQTQYECLRLGAWTALPGTIMGCAVLDCTPPENRAWMSDKLCICEGYIAADRFREHELNHCRGRKDYDRQPVSEGKI